MQKNNKILIIEDDPHMSELLEIHLGDLGYQLKHAADGVAGVEKFEEDEYALVILDLMLPKLDGFEVCKKNSRSKQFHSHFNANLKVRRIG